MTHLKRLRATGQETARVLDGLQLQMPATDGADQRSGQDQHAGALSTRHRAFCALHTDQNGRLVVQNLQGLGKGNPVHDLLQKGAIEASQTATIAW